MLDRLTHWINANDIAIFRLRRLGSLLEWSTGLLELKLLLAYELFCRSKTSNIWSLIFNDDFPSLKSTAQEVKHWNMDVLFFLTCPNRSGSSCVSSLVGRRLTSTLLLGGSLWNPVRKQLLNMLSGPLGTNSMSDLVNSETFCFQVCLILCFVQIEPVGFVLMCS